MGGLGEILTLWRRAQARGDRVCLATVVHVEGSSYRKPGARMLVTSAGERAGTISGGCLEAEVSRKAWWLTERGPTVERYQSSFDEDGTGIPWGLGCGGTISLLLERDPTPVFAALEAAVERDTAAVLVACLTGPTGTLAVYSHPLISDETDAPGELPSPLRAAGERARTERRSFFLDATFAPAQGSPAYFVEYLPPPPRLTIFGAGDDAQPIVCFAQALGWRVAVADGRSHLLRRERFPGAAELRLLEYNEIPLACGLDGVPVGNTERTGPVQTGTRPGELAVVLTHSYEQDRALLAALLPEPLGFLGILGPRHRTARLVEEVAPTLGWSVERCLARLHAPVGLDLGARDPAAIALSIVAEMQATLAGRSVRLLPTAAPQAAPVSA